MGTAYQHNIGAFVALMTSVFPQSSGAATLNGASIDRFAHNLPLSCVLHQIVGADSGAPTGLSVQTILQHSPDNTTWTNFTPDGSSTAAQTPALTAVDTENSLSVDLGGAARYIRAVTTVAFTGGTSPAALVAAQILLGGEQLLPAV